MESKDKAVTSNNMQSIAKMLWKLKKWQKPTKPSPLLPTEEATTKLKKLFPGNKNAKELLKEEVQQLKDEIAVLKGQKPRPKIPPSNLEGPHSKVASS
jgi:hypothetical protein